MRKRILYTVLLVALGLNLFIGANIYIANAKGATKDDAYAQIELFSRVLERVRKDYVDGEKLTYQDLIYGALRGMLSTLDPHSEFMEPDKYEDLKQDTEGAFGGVGIVVSLKDGYLTVVAPMDDTPAFRAGVMSGDRIIKIDGKLMSGKPSLPEAVKKLRGEPGSKVTISFLRVSNNQTRDIDLTREVIKVKTVKDINNRDEFPLSENKIGYVRLSQFNEPTATELEDGLKKMDAQGVQGLVLDLRGNPGGLLDQAVAVCEKFLPAKQLIVSTEGRSPSMRSQYNSHGGSRVGIPIVVLVNGGSASASEIVAGCLQDLKRAVVVGEQTFGKGSVQSILPLQSGNNGPALRLTTAKYYTPSHKVIHEKGITPDIVIPVTAEEEEALFYQRTPGGLESLDEEKREKVKTVRDVQLDRANDLLKGITLFTHRANGNKKIAVK